MSTAGYSGVPLSAKLGIKPGQRVVLIDAPPDHAAALAPLPAGVQFVERVDSAVDLVQLFVTRREDLAAQLQRLRRELRQDAVLWVSWPKKASKVPTTVTEDVIRELALALGFVDVKVCAVSEVWSGLKLVVRKALR